MKKSILTISLLSLTFILFSCSSSDKNNSTLSGSTSNDNINVTIKPWNTPAPVFEDRKVETKVKNWELTIWENVNIKKWKASDFPSEFPIISWWEIYQNSNMQNYAFIIEENKSLQDIYNYYKKELEKKWYTDKTVTKKDIKIEELSVINLEFIKLDEKIDITLNKNIPDILVETLKLKWNFIEIYITKIEK